jgi:hypothetical protein
MGNLAMADLLIAILCVAVFWLLVKQWGRAEERRQMEQLAARLERLERQIYSGVNSSQPPQPVPVPAAPQRPGPILATPPVAPPTAARVSAERPPAGLVQPRPAFVVPAASQGAPVPAGPQRSGPFVPPPPPLRPAAAPDHATVKRSVSLEERLGQNWLNKLGIVILVIGLALFLGYQLRTLGPAGKSGIGMLLSLALLGGGLWLERRLQYRIFARAAIGGGWALTFFVTFALYHVQAMQVLHSQGVDLVLMLIVAAAMVGHSLRYKSQVVTSLAFLLAFVTVGISEVTLFSLVAGVVLAVGLVYVAAREYWFGLALAGLVGIYVNHFLWLHRVLPQGGQPGYVFPEYAASAALLVLYWLLFRLLYVLRVPQTHDQQVVSSLTAVLNSVGLMSLLKYQSSHPEWAFWGLLALGVAEFVLAFVARTVRKDWRMAFVVLVSIGSILLLGAIPFRFSGSNWSLLWLLQAELLFVLGVLMPESAFRRLGLAGGFAALMQVLIADVAPIFNLRQSAPDLSRHPAVAATLFTAAVLFWFNAEFAPRRWQLPLQEDVERVVLGVTSYMALATALLGLWVFVPRAWTVVAWLVLVLALGFLADSLQSRTLAAQADFLAAVSVLRLALVNFAVHEHWGAVSLRVLTVGLASALLYANMRRRTENGVLPAKAIAPMYSWAACAVAASLLEYELQANHVAVGWAVFGVALFELGMRLRRDYLRHQAYALLAAGFLWMSVANLATGGVGKHDSARMYVVLGLMALYAWVYGRLSAAPLESRFERGVATVAAWAGLVAAAALTYLELRGEWVGIGWAALALLCLTLAWALKRTVFVVQALGILLLAGMRVGLVNLPGATSTGAAFAHTRVFCVAVACALMLLALPQAFGVRRQHAAEEPRLLFRPEQSFFFMPLLLVTLLLAVELRAGVITIGWGGLGVAVFLFALVVKERSYRLAGLGLLLLAVAKILCVDVWHANPTDRYITLIVIGASLLLVSFLYSRYKETLLKLL